MHAILHQVKEWLEARMVRGENRAERSKIGYLNATLIRLEGT